MDEDLTHSLKRAIDALSRTPEPPASEPPAGAGRSSLAAILGAMGALFVVLGATTGRHRFLVLGVLLCVAAAAVQAASRGRSRLSAPGVSIGASVGRGAEIDPTAAVEMGASVGERVRLGPRAVVRMGANVGDGAVLEADALVSWGVDIGDGAVIGAGAIVGAGTSVGAGAHVPAGFVLRPGSSFEGRPRTASTDRSPPPARVHAASSREAAVQTLEPVDPRAARVEAACAKLASELEASPERVRSFLGDPAGTVDGLRQTCAELLRREAALRREADVTRLAEERVAIEARIEREEDSQVRESLRGALTAIDGQRQEREALRLTADRLDAEHTRLLYTLEQLAAQVARMRSAGEGPARAPQELQQGVKQLRGELEAIADALESVAVAPPDETSADAAHPRPDARTR
jgi:carbonic anhydrase/acetyltransferase-like protein (isoleucine patch superfamily)/uncharacterized protein YukE